MGVEVGRLDLDGRVTAAAALAVMVAMAVVATIKAQKGDRGTGPTGDPPVVRDTLPDMDDPDGDGLPNVYELAYGRNPWVPDSALVQKLTVGPDGEFGDIVLETCT